MKELKLVIATYDNDNLMKILLPMVEKKFKESLPDIVIEVTTGLELKRPIFTGVKQWLELFKLEWYYTPSDLVAKFKNTVNLV